MCGKSLLLSGLTVKGKKKLTVSRGGGEFMVLHLALRFIRLGQCGGDLVLILSHNQGLTLTQFRHGGETD